VPPPLNEQFFFLRVLYVLFFSVMSSQIEIEGHGLVELNNCEITFSKRPMPKENHVCPKFRVLDLIKSGYFAVAGLGMIKDYQVAGVIRHLIDEGVPKPLEVGFRIKNVSNDVDCNLTVTVLYFKCAGVSRKTMSIIRNSTYYCGHDSGICVPKRLADRINSVAIVLETAPSDKADNFIL